MTPEPQFVEYLERQGRTLADFPVYRLVWSDAQFEMRRGTFNEFSGSLFLRAVTGVKEVPKYPFVKSRWILEKFFPPEVAFTEDLPNSRQGLYEPLFVFQTKNFEPLPVTLRVLELLVNFDRNYSQPSNFAKACQDRTFAELAEAKEFEYLLDAIDTTALQSQLHMKEAIVKP